MTDQELCKALRWTLAHWAQSDAADRIEALAAQVEALKAELLAAQNQIGDLCWDAGCASVRHQRLADLADALTEAWVDARAESRKLYNDLMGCIAPVEVGGGIVNYMIERERDRAARAEANADQWRKSYASLSATCSHWERRAEKAEAVIAGLKAWVRGPTSALVWPTSFRTAFFAKLAELEGAK